MIASNRPRDRKSQILRSQAALELALTTIGAMAALTLLRTVVLIAGVGDRIWSGSFLLAASRPLVRPLELLPGGSRDVVGSASLADLTTTVLLLVLPVFILSRPVSP